ncbi:MAG: hypothetical protein P1U57_05800, partial [Oleibacter sp.]|nr:hypothetical protein [Thalassolituus sp.]
SDCMRRIEGTWLTELPCTSDAKFLSNLSQGRYIFYRQIVWQAICYDYKGIAISLLFLLLFSDSLDLPCFFT